MASDISSIIKSEFSATLGQLLSKEIEVVSVAKTESSEYESTQAIDVCINFEFKTLTSTWHFFIPTKSATIFEYLMLGGIGDVKDSIDEETTDAVSEIISNICGGITTSINAQGYEDLGSVKFSATGNETVESDEIGKSENLYTLVFSLDDENLSVFIALDKLILPFAYEITGVEEDPSSMPQAQTMQSSSQGSRSVTTSNSSSLGAPVSISDEAMTNLKLLFDIKLKFSVRLGSKIFLLKDILQWDVGEIIELEQMVNEPLEILVNGIKVGEGEAVVVEGKFGLKVKKIGDGQKDLLNSMGLR